MALCKLAGVTADPAYDLAEVMENVTMSLKRPHPWLHQLPEFNKEKKGRPIAIVGGGPSLKDHVDELREFNVIMAVGSVHDWLMQEGIVPRYSILVDAHPTVTASYLKNPHTETNYLVASQCNATVFDAIEGHPITLWHCLSNDAPEWLTSLDPGYQGLGGGCTAGLRALGMAAVLGYRNVHLFGFDSCISQSGDAYAYPLQNPEVENEGIAPERTFDISVGGPTDGPDGGEPTGQRFICYGYHLAQAQNFEEFFRHHHNRMTFTFHGGGLLAYVHKIMLAEIGRQERFEEKAA